MKVAAAFIIVIALSSLTACSRGEADTPGEHVWKEQTDTIDRARGVEDTLRRAAKARQDDSGG